MKIISHRGKINNIKNEENNYNSIINFLNSDIEMIEIDIQITNDNEIILYHDNKIKTNKGEKFIHNLDSSYLIQNYNLILLKNALELIQGKRQIYLDIKNNKLDLDKSQLLLKKLLFLLDSYVLKYKCERSDIYICSFYNNYLSFIKDIPLEYKRGIILYKNNIYDFINKYRDNVPFDFISIDYNLIDQINIYKNYQKIIFCYTINKMHEYHKIKQNENIDGIISDVPKNFYGIS